MPLLTLTLFATVQPEEPVVPSRLIPAVTLPKTVLPTITEFGASRSSIPWSPLA